MKFLVAIVVCCILVSAIALPTSFSVEKSLRASADVETSANANSDGPINFDGSNVGVNIAGFHASAGLGGLLTGDASKGGLHAEAGGHGTGAGAGIGGGTGAGAGASAGAFAHAHASAGASAGAGAGAETSYGHKTIRHQAEIVAEKTFTEQPKVVNEKTIQGAAQVQRTVIEKTVIPQYVEKTIQVPSYVEKTIRVPTVIEHKVRVPVTPKIVEKTYEENGHASAGAYAHAQKHVTFGAQASAGANAERVMLEERPPPRVYKEYNVNNGFLGGIFGGGVRNTASANSEAFANTGSSFQANGYAYKSGGGLLGNILNIPVATLGAVGNLLNSFGQGQAGGSFAINKHYRSY